MFGFEPAKQTPNGLCFMVIANSHLLLHKHLIAILAANSCVVCCNQPATFGQEAV